MVGADLGEDGGDELLALHLPGDAALQTCADPCQLRLVMRRLPERAQHHGGRLNGGQPFALHIAHDDPDTTP